MATFAKATFNAAKYASIRPTYPKLLYDIVFAYHSRNSDAQWDLAVDLGCGTGQVTTQLTAKFERVIGIDPSERMIAQAEAKLSPDSAYKISYRQASASLPSLTPILSPKSVDLFIAGQSAHWFPYPEIYNTLAHFLKPSGGGTYAFFGYSEFRLTSRPLCTPLINAYSQGPPPDGLGEYWEQPGRSILDNHFLDLPIPKEEEGWVDWERIYFTGEHFPELPNARDVILRKKADWSGLETYLRTFSSLHTFHEKHPEDLERKEENVAERYDKEKGDIVQRFLGRLQEQFVSEGVSSQEEFQIEWPLALVLARRK